MITCRQRLGHNRLIAVAVSVLLAMAPSAGAVIIQTSDGSGNTSAPANDPGWANVGLRGATGVYLGNQWVLTANHVGEGPITLADVTYNPIVGTGVQIQNPVGAGLSTFTDLYMYRISGNPGLPMLSISQSPPGVGQEVTMIGFGNDRAAGLTHWNVTESGMNWIWNEAAAPGDHSGFKWLGTRSKRWGRNHIEDDGEADLDHNVVFDAGFGDVIGLATDFDESGGAMDEAQAASGDSGGAVFYDDAGNWELAGLLLAIDTLHGQPAAAVYGNQTLLADLSIYESQVSALLAVPEPSTLLLTTLGLLWLGCHGWRRQS